MKNLWRIRFSGRATFPPTSAPYIKMIRHFFGWMRQPLKPLKNVDSSATMGLLLSVTLFMALFAASFSPCASASVAYGLGGNVYITSNAGGTVYRNTPLTGQTSLSDYIDNSMATTYPWDRGQTAIAQYYGNLATGELKAFCSAASSDTATAFARSIYVEMKDTLFFSIPAGTYESGLSATIYGSLNGSFFATGDASCIGDFEATFGSATFVQKYDTPQTNLLVDLPFSLTTWVVRPNTTFTTDKTISIIFDMAIGGDGKFWASSPNLGFTNSATTDFYNTLEIRSLDTPTGYGWTSASGVFLTDRPNPVPIPPSMILFSSGLIGLVGYGRRKSFKGQV